MIVEYIKLNDDLSCDVNVDDIIFNISPKLKGGVLTALSENEAIDTAKVNFNILKRKTEFEEAGVRGKRDRLLTNTDWVVVKYKELGKAVPAAWKTYRQALRDITEQEGFPHDVTFPEEPTES